MKQHIPTKRQTDHNMYLPSVTVGILNPGKYKMPKEWSENIEEKNGKIIYTIKTPKDDHSATLSNKASYIQYKYKEIPYYAWRSAQAEEFYKKIITNNS